MALFPDLLLTDRLRLVGLPAADLDPLEFYAVCSAPEMDRTTEYLPWDPHETPAVSADFLAESTEAWAANERSVYAIYPRDGEAGAGTFAGLCHLEPDWDTRSASVGVFLRERFRGRGYSGERAAALCLLAFERLDLDVVVAECAADNDASRRAIERYVDAYGGRYEGRLRNARRAGDEVWDVHRFTVAAEEWAASDHDVTVRVP